MHLETEQLWRGARRGVIYLAWLSLIACGDDSGAQQSAAKPEPEAASEMESSPSVSSGPMDSAGPGPSPTTALAETSSGRSHYKGGRRYVADLAEALELPVEGVCLELSAYDCERLVHRISLGGVEPYALGVRTPLPEPPVTAPIAVDRIALSACERKVRTDLAGSDGLFGTFTSGADSEQREVAIRLLYDRLLRRDATPAETQTLTEFYEEVAASSENPGQDWLILSCFSVASSLEALFY